MVTIKEVKEGQTVGCFSSYQEPPAFAFVGEVMEVREAEEVIVVKVEILQHVPIKDIHILGG